MLNDPFRQRLLAEFDSLPRQIRAAAQWVLDNPRDVALLSMREQAKRAGVTPASMTRLAQRMGLEGFEELRDLHADRIRRGEEGFSSRAEALVARRNSEGDGALALDLIEAVECHLQGLAVPATLDPLMAASEALARARSIFVLGFRASYPIASHFAYLASLAGNDAQLLEGPGGTGADKLKCAGPNDAMLAVSVKPYTRAAVELIDYCSVRHLNTVAITDSEVSPLVPRAQAAIIVPCASPSFFPTMTPAFAIVEALAAMLAARAGGHALEAVRSMELQFNNLSIHF